VRFADGRQLYSQLLGTLRDKFLTTDLTARATVPAPVGQAAEHGHDLHAAAAQQSAVVEWARGGPPAAPLPPPPLTRQVPLPLPPTSVPAFRPFGSHDSSAAAPLAAARDTETQHTARRDAPHSAASHRSGDGLQIHNRYLVTETEDGLVVIDQHALHERILYEQLRQRVLAGTLEAQRLLVPEPVSLSPPEVAAVLEARDFLARLGIDVQPFGGDTLLVSSYPAMLANFHPADILRQVVEQLLVVGRSPDRRDLLDELLHMISCKAAVKAGDRLSREEVHALLEQRHLYQDTHHCPHGRPTALVFTQAELDKRFKRL
jgi:DNA mismatch repair protein MutL